MGQSNVLTEYDSRFCTNVEAKYQESLAVVTVLPCGSALHWRIENFRVVQRRKLISFDHICGERIAVDISIFYKCLSFG